MTGIKAVVDNQDLSALPSSWDTVDLASIWDRLEDGTMQHPVPTVGEIAGGGALFYPGRINAVFGRFGSAKSYVAAVTALQQIAAGADVWWFDFEDDPIGMVQRLIELGGDRDGVIGHFHYLNPSDALDPEEVETLIGTLPSPGLVVIDSTGEWMSLQGFRSNYDEEVAAFGKRHLTPLSRTGGAVVGVDHVPHDAKDPLRAIGSQRKMAAISGAAYAIEMTREMGRGRSGMTRLTCAKDRGGHHQRGTVVAELTIDATCSPYKISLETPAAVAGPLVDEPPAVRRVHSALLSATPPARVRQLGDIVARDGHSIRALKRDTIQKALRRLEELGLASRVGGDQATGHEWAPATDPDQKGGAHT